MNKTYKHTGDIAYLFLDIETIPGPERPAVAAPPAPTRDMAQAPPNYKDPEKILRYEAERFQTLLAKHAQDIQSADDKADKQWHAQGLNGMHGQTCSCGWALGHDEPTVACIQDRADEAQVLECLLGAIQGFMNRFHVVFVGFNVRPFDLLFLRHRAYKLAPSLAHVLPRERFDKRVIDLRNIWNPHDLNAKGKQDEIAEFLGLPGKPSFTCPFCEGTGLAGHLDCVNGMLVDEKCPHCEDGTMHMDGSKVWPLFQLGRLDLITTYQADDVAQIRGIFERMGGFEGHLI